MAWRNPRKMKDFFYLLKWQKNLKAGDAIAKLKMHNHIPEYMPCDKCGTGMIMHRDPSRFDLFRWVCKSCKNRRPIRYRTWAARHRISLMDLLMVIRYYVEGRSAKVAAIRTMQNEIVCAQVYSDISDGLELYADEMYNVIYHELKDNKLLENVNKARGNFWGLNKYLPLHVVYKIVLDSLSRMFINKSLLKGHSVEADSSQKESM